MRYASCQKTQLRFLSTIWHHIIACKKTSHLAFFYTEWFNKEKTFTDSQATLDWVRVPNLASCDVRLCWGSKYVFCMYPTAEAAVRRTLRWHWSITEASKESEPLATGVMMPLTIQASPCSSHLWSTQTSYGKLWGMDCCFVPLSLAEEPYLPWTLWPWLRHRAGIWHRTYNLHSSPRSE